MEFCPKCEVRLKKNDDGLLSCLKCNYVKKKTDKPTKRHHQGNRHRNRRSHRIKKTVGLQDKGKLNGILPKM